MSKTTHTMILSLQFDGAVPPKQAVAIISRLLAGAPIEQAIYEESVRHDNTKAPIGFHVSLLQPGLNKKVAEVTDPWDEDDESEAILPSSAVASAIK